MAEAKKAAVTTFEVLNSVNVNDHVEVKDTGKAKLTYLSWAWAWAEVKKRYPDANYEIVKFNGIPYVYDENTGYMVYTTVTIEGITHEMWLPVMDGNNKAMLAHPYEVQTKYSKFTVQAATMFDVNKAIMRCLTKNLAMFGLGLYIYAGEDLPETVEETIEPAKTPAKKKAEPVQEAPKTAERSPARQKLADFCEEHKLSKEQQKKIIIDCKLTPNSTDEEYETALRYAEDLIGAGRPDDYGNLPFEV